MKKFLAIILAAIMTLGVCGVCFALEENEARVVLGADLNDTQKAEALSWFGVTDGNVPVLTVTNKDERQYFEGKLPEKMTEAQRIALAWDIIDDIEAEAESRGIEFDKSRGYCFEVMYVGEWLEHKFRDN